MEKGYDFTHNIEEADAVNEHINSVQREIKKERALAQRRLDGADSVQASIRIGDKKEDEEEYTR